MPFEEPNDTGGAGERRGVVREERLWSQPQAGAAAGVDRDGLSDTACETVLAASGSPIRVRDRGPAIPPAAEAGPDAGPAFEPEPPDFDPDPFAEIPGFAPAAAAPGEYVLLPASLHSRFDLREFTRFLGTLRTVVRDWEGAPEVEDGGIRLRGTGGGAWVYPEARRVRVVTDGETGEPVAEDLVALCRWLDTRAGMRLYPAGEAAGGGVDRSLDPWETFLGA
jgi:hypothetical protein